MDALRIADAAARVVAWHNRHPLARRITPADVGTIGVVALPFAQPPAPPHAETDGAPDAASDAAPKAAADAAPSPAALRPLFGPEWMFRIAPRRLGEWVRRHGRPLPAACAGWPLRQVDAELAPAHRADADGLEGRTLRHVLTAVIDLAGHRVRVLMAPTLPLRRAPVFGPRLWSPLRVGTAAAGSAAAAAALLLALGAPRPGTPPASAPAPPGAPGAPVAAAAQPTPGPGVAPPEPHPAPGAAVAVAAPAPPATPATPAGPPAAAASAAARPATPAAEPAVPPAAEPHRPADVPVTLADRAAGAAPLVSIRPRLGAADRQAARAVAEAAQTARRAAAAPALAGRQFALATPAARSRDDALAQQALLQGLLAQTAGGQPTRVDVMAARGRWRAVWWPHPERAQAEQLLQAARARGLKVELIEF